MATEADVSWFVGEDKTLRFTVYQADGETVQNITGWTLEWAVRRFLGSTDALLTKTTGSGISITDGPNGICEVSLARTDTDTLGRGGFYHALRRTNSGASTVLTFGEAVADIAASE